MRGIALVFFFAGIAMVVLAIAAFASKPYRTLSAEFMRDSEAPRGAAEAVDPGNTVTDTGR